MVRVYDIASVIENIAPTDLAESWDNVGLLVGKKDGLVKKVFVALDFDENTLNEAIKNHCDLIVTHHPIMIKPISKINDDTAQGRLILKLIEEKIALYSAHTNMDSANGGVNDLLANVLQLKNVQKIALDEDFEGRVGDIEVTKFADLMPVIKERLNLKYLRFVGDKEKNISKIAICGGGGAGFIPNVVGKCDLYLTADVKYHDAQFAEENNLCVIDAGHFETERAVCEFFAKIINENFQRRGVEVILSQRKKSYIKYA